MPFATEYPPTAEENSAFLSKREVLRLIPICATTLWNWSRNGKFPVPQIMGSKTVWRSSEVFAWMEKRPTRQYKKREA